MMKLSEEQLKEARTQLAFRGGKASFAKRGIEEYRKMSIKGNKARALNKKLLLESSK